MRLQHWHDEGVQEAMPAGRLIRIIASASDPVQKVKSGISEASELIDAIKDMRAQIEVLTDQVKKLNENLEKLLEVFGSAGCSDERGEKIVEKNAGRFEQRFQQADDRMKRIERQLDSILKTLERIERRLR